MKFKIFILTLIAATSLLFASDILDSFSAASDGKNITVSWKSNDESNIKAYDIERSGSSTDFKVVASIQAKGYSYSYSYLDDGAFLKDGGDPTPQQKTTYKYRIRVIFKDNTSSYSNTAYVAHNVSGIRRTWGMIKQMFL